LSGHSDNTGTSVREISRVVPKATRLGLQPRAPGMSSHPAGRSTPGRPVIGYP
jgi:hypothetical protein